MKHHCRKVLGMCEFVMCQPIFKTPLWSDLCNSINGQNFGEGVFQFGYESTVFASSPIMLNYSESATLNNKYFLDIILILWLLFLSLENKQHCYENILIWQT